MNCNLNISRSANSEALWNLPRVAACALAVSTLATTLIAGLFPGLPIELQFGLFAASGVTFILSAALLIQQVIKAIRETNDRVTEAISKVNDPRNPFSSSVNITLSPALQEPIEWTNPYKEPFPWEEWSSFLSARHKGTLFSKETGSSFKPRRRLGSGSSKVAYEFSEDGVLLFPNGELKKLPAEWHRQLFQEVEVSKRIESLGLMTSKQTRVDLATSKESPNTFPAYTCPSFDALAKQGIYVIDCKEGKWSKWKDQSFFPGNEDRFSFESWAPIIKPLVRDMYILANNNLVMSIDSMNYAVVRTENGYVVRYFGFDFSNKGVTVDRRFVTKREFNPLKRARSLLDFPLSVMFILQCNHDWDCETQSEEWGRASKAYAKLRKECVKRCHELLKEY